MRAKQGIPHTEELEETVKKQEEEKKQVHIPVATAAARRSQRQQSDQQEYSPRLVGVLIVGVIVGAVRNLIK